MPSNMDDMQETTSTIANRVRGVAAEKRFTQDRVASTLGIARSSVSARYNGSVAFTGTELFTLAAAMGVRVERFFPDAGERAA